jgi:hypothetical protein
MEDISMLTSKKLVTLAGKLDELSKPSECSYALIILWLYSLPSQAASSIGFVQEKKI